MVRIHIFGFACFLVFLASSPLLADLAPGGGGRPRPTLPPKPTPAPEESKANTAPVVIKRGAIPAGDRPVVAKIQIPRSLAKQLTAIPAAKDSGATGFDFRTLIAGLSLSGAAVCGLLVMRGKRAARWVAAGCVALSAALGAWSYATADIPPPPKTTADEVEIELVDGTDTVTIFTAE